MQDHPNDVHPDCPAVHRTVDVLFVPLPRTAYQTPSQRDDLSVSTESVYQWMVENFDLDICANGVFRGGVARVLSPEGLYAKHAVLRLDQYCCDINMIAYDKMMRSKKVTPPTNRHNPDRPKPKDRSAAAAKYESFHPFDVSAKPSKSRADSDDEDEYNPYEDTRYDQKYDRAVRAWREAISAYNVLTEGVRWDDSYACNCVRILPNRYVCNRGRFVCSFSL